LRPTQPSSAVQGGAAFAHQPVVQLKDANGNPVVQAGVLVSAAVASGPSPPSLPARRSSDLDANGKASFTNLAISGPVGSYALGFTAATYTGVTSSAIVLSAGPASQLVFTVQPSNAVAGAVITPAVKVTVRDAFGNTTTTFTA